MLSAFVPVSWTLLVSTSLPAEPHETAGWVGTNYTPAYCVNTVELWHDFRPDVIEKELAAAKEHFGITTLRVYLHNIPYNAEKQEFLQRIGQFLTICRRHGIRPGFTFFDDCWNHEGVSLESLPPVKGRHNGRWAACPQDVERTDENLPELRAYVQDVIRAHRDDPRVLWWDIFNEPNLKSPFSARLRTLAYGWAKELEPIQPVLSCWDDSPETDVVDAHNYSNHFAQWDRQTELNPEKGAVFTEAGARWYAPRPSNGEPVEVIDWLQRRRAAGKYVPGVYLCWELMVGNSNCRWYWGTEDGTPEPTIPWCGLLWPDGTPVSLAEAETIRHYTTGRKQALFFDDFQDSPPGTERPGWKAYGSLSATEPGGRPDFRAAKMGRSPSSGGSGVLMLPPDMKMIAGDTGWTDYVLEAVVMLKEGDGDAGLVFRVNDPRPGHDEMRGYYVGLDTRTLHLGKMQNNWEPLAEYDLSQLECKVVPGVWNLIRIAVEGPRIRVWLNRMPHDDGLRIDHTDRPDRSDRSDQNAPILSGAVGVRAHHVSAWFDNVVVLPIEALPEAVAR